jgi:flagellar biosynthesis repressor protein FlbT
MNRYRTTGLPTPAAAHRSAFSSSRGLKITLITLDNFTASRAVYLALTAIRKDCGDNRQKAGGRDQSRHNFAIRRKVSSRKIRQRRSDMALKVELKPHERIIIGACVVTNTDQRARLLIDGDNIPILREKDILTPETADTPAKLVYLAVQLMYISPDPQINHGTYFNLVRDIVTTVPSAWPIIEGINNHILNGDLYQALKEAKKLVAYERQLLDYSEAVQGEAAATAEAKRSA